MNLHITTHGGKLKGIPSISTAASMNPHCRRRAACGNSECICSHCFARRHCAVKKGLQANIEDNFRQLQTLHPVADFPVVNALYFRLESFGDCASVNQARNYLRLCRRNPRTTFAVWTKNIGYYRQAIKLEDGKPRNLVLIVSSPMIGRTANVTAEDRGIVDHVFTVMPKSTPEKEINCGARSCLGCLRCYRRGGSFDVTEVLK